MKEIAPCGFHINFSHIEEEKNENKNSEKNTDETFRNYESTITQSLRS